jgi:hypothetical protein
MPGSVKKEMQLAVDQYLSVYQEYKKMKDQVDTLREVIEPYMKENDLPFIEGTDGRGKVERTLQERPTMNARYTTYDIHEIAGLLSPALKKKCVVEVVDKDKLEALCKLGEVPEDILNRKVTKQSYSFVARFQK